MSPGQLELLKSAAPVGMSGIDLRLCLVEEMLTSGISGARLVVADPPWQYDRSSGSGCAANHYDCPSMGDIVTALDMAYACCAEDAYLVTFATWPMLADFVLRMQQGRWAYVSGGSWHKTGGMGVGYHWRGNSEPVLLWRKGTPKPQATIGNAWAAPRLRHSEKPVSLLVDILTAFSSPGDLVLSVYSGMCPEARAAKMTGRRLIGAEVDPARHEMALGLLAQVRAQ